MKKIFTLSLLLCSTLSFGQIEGTWRLADQAGALGVGPGQGDISWWSNSLPDVTTRACLFDDSITFDASGVMTHYMDGSTWLEGWQGVTEGCGTPIAPHDGNPASPYTYSFDAAAGTVTVNGLGAHIGLAKVYNLGELASPADAVSTITYIVAFSNNDNNMTVDIEIAGGGFWRFEYERTIAPVVVDPTVTFSVDMSEYTGTIGTAVNLSGEFNGWCGDCAPMTDMGGGVYELAVQMPAGTYQYKFSVDNWTDQEALTPGDVCVDTISDGFDNRIYTVTVDETLPVVCWNSCDACALGLNEMGNAELFQVVPNPANDQVVVNFEGNAQDLTILDLSGRVVKTINAYTSGAAIDVSDLDSGMFIVTSNKGAKYSTVLLKE
jgi:hypothetical protein